MSQKTSQTYERFGRASHGDALPSRTSTLRHPLLPLLCSAALFWLAACNTQPDSEGSAGTPTPEDVVDDAYSDVEDAEQPPDAGTPPEYDSRQPEEEDVDELDLEPGTSQPLEPLRLDYIEPAVIVAGHETRLWIYGAGMSAESELYINGQLLGDIDIVDEYTALATSPALEPGAYSLRALSLGETAELASALSVERGIELRSVEPTVTTTAAGTPITIRGAGFTEPLHLTVGGHSVASFNIISPELIEAATPRLVAGPVSVRASTLSATATLTDAFTALAPATIESISPLRVPVHGGVLIELNGTGFSSVDSWFINDLEIDASGNDERRTFIAPPMPPGWSSLTFVESSGRTERLDRALLYEGGQSAPYLSGASPEQVASIDGSALLFGAGLADTVAVEVDSRPVDFTILSDAELALGPMGGLVGHRASVSVTLSGGEVLTLDETWRWVLEPTITQVIPHAGRTDGGEPVLLLGTGLTSDTVIYFGTQQATVLDAGPAGIEVVTPPAAAGFVDIRAENDGVTSLRADAFEYFAGLEIFSVIPDRAAISGGTEVMIIGNGFNDDTVITFDGRPATDLHLIEPTVATLRVPATESVGAAAVRADRGDDSVEFDGVFTYYEPFGSDFGWGGAEVAGAINIKLISRPGGAAVEGAHLQLLDEQDQPLTSAVSDARGYATLSRIDLEGAQTIHVGAECHSSATIHDVDATRFTIILDYICEPEDEGDGELPPADWGAISGHITGLNKLASPGPGKSLLAVAYASAASPYSRTPLVRLQPPTFYHPQATGIDGSFPPIYVSPGPRAAIALCGVYDEFEDSFEPLAMGVARNLIVDSQQEVQVQLACDIPLSQSLTIKLVESPISSDPDLNHEALVYLNLGADGWFGGWSVAQGPDSVLTVEDLPPLNGPLSDVSVMVYAGAFAPSGAASVTYGRHIRSYSSVVTLPRMVGIPQRTVPESSIFEGRHLEWRVDSRAQPAFYWLLLDDLLESRPIWEAFVPGDNPTLQLPYFDEGASVSPFPEPGGLIATYVYAIKPIVFNFNNFTPNYLGQNSWEAYATNTWLLVAE